MDHLDIAASISSTCREEAGAMAMLTLRVLSRSQWWHEGVDIEGNEIQAGVHAIEGMDSVGHLRCAG